MNQDSYIVLRVRDLAEHANAVDVHTIERVMNAMPTPAAGRLVPVAWRITWPNGRSSRWKELPAKRMTPSYGPGAEVQIAYGLVAPHA